jgi:hypothetical protein
MENFAPMLRCGKVVSTGPPCMMTPCHLFAIHHHMGVTMENFAPMLRCDKVVSTGPPCMMTPCHLFDAATNVRGTEISIQGMQCH